MSFQKRAPAIPLSLKQIHNATIKKNDNQTLIETNNQLIYRVRVFGVILNRFENVTNADNPYVSLLLDDGTDTIYLRYFDSEYANESTTKLIMEKAKSGQIVDVSARVREYNNLRYLAPDLIKLNKSIQWELNQRALRVNHSIVNYVTNTQTEMDIPEEMKEKSLLILQAMMDNIDENTSVKLSERANLPLDKTEEIITFLRMEDLIITPRAGKYKKL